MCQISGDLAPWVSALGVWDQRISNERAAEMLECYWPRDPGTHPCIESIPCLSNNKLVFDPSIFQSRRIARPRLAEACRNCMREV